MFLVYFVLFCLFVWVCVVAMWLFAISKQWKFRRKQREREKERERMGLCYYFPCNPFGFSLNSDMFIVWLRFWKLSQLKTLGMVQSCLGSIILQNVLRFAFCVLFFYISFICPTLSKKIIYKYTFINTNTNTNKSTKERKKEKNDRFHKFE